MRKVKTIAAVLIVSFVTLAGFQNCSGSGSSQGSNSEVSSLSSPDPQSTVNSAQSTINKITGAVPTTLQDLEKAIQALQQSLQQLQAINLNGLPPSLRQQILQLIQQIIAEINQLDTAIAALNGGQSCSFNGQTVPSGASVTAYQSSSVPSGQTCQSQTRACSGGQLSGSYTFASCTVQSVAVTCSPGNYWFCNPTSSGGSTYTCSFPGSSLWILDINSVEVDGSFTAEGGWGGGAIQHYTGNCSNGNLTISEENGAVLFSGSYGLPTNYTVALPGAGMSPGGPFVGSGMTVRSPMGMTFIGFLP